jgi:hypothetical protein
MKKQNFQMSAKVEDFAFNNGKTSHAAAAGHAGSSACLR